MIDVFCSIACNEDGSAPFCDMSFEIVWKQYDEAQQAWHLKVEALHDRLGVIGFGASIPVIHWREQIDDAGDEAFHSYWGAVLLWSTGDNSNRLLQALAGFYGLLETSASLASQVKLTPEIQCLAVGLNDDPAGLAHEPVHLKLFFDQGVEGGRYAELFLEIDLPTDVVRLNEKDEEYRGDLIAWLSRPGPMVAHPYLDQSVNQW